LNQYKNGIEHHQAESGSIRIYHPEKTVCDMFRYRNKLKEDLALEGLKQYLRQADRDLNKLIEFAEIFVLTYYVANLPGLVK